MTDGRDFNIRGLMIYVISPPFSMAASYEVEDDESSLLLSMYITNGYNESHRVSPLNEWMDQNGIPSTFKHQIFVYWGFYNWSVLQRRLFLKVSLFTSNVVKLL